MIRLFIVDNARVLSHIMASVLREEPDISVVGTVATVDEAIPYLNRCDVLLVTATLPDDGALTLVHMAAEQSPGTKVIIMDWPETPTGFLQQLLSSIAGFVSENDSVDELLRKIRSLASTGKPASVATKAPSTLVPAFALKGH